MSSQGQHTTTAGPRVQHKNDVFLVKHWTAIKNNRHDLLRVPQIQWYTVLLADEGLLKMLQHSSGCPTLLMPQGAKPSTASGGWCRSAPAAMLWPHPCGVDTVAHHQQMLFVWQNKVDIIFTFPSVPPQAVPEAPFWLSHGGHRGNVSCSQCYLVFSVPHIHSRLQWYRALHWWRTGI